MYCIRKKDFLDTQTCPNPQLPQEKTNDLVTEQEEEDFLEVSSASAIEVISDDELDNDRRVELEDYGTQNINLSVTIDKVRKIVRMFRSSTKNEKLQIHVRSEHGKELMLKLDSKTR